MATCQDLGTRNDDRPSGSGERPGQQVAAVNTYLGPRNLYGDPARLAGLETLSGREREVLHLITNAWSNHEIAAELHLGITTVKTYIRLAYRKMGVDSRSQAVLWGVHRGLLDGDEVVRRD